MEVLERRGFGLHVALSTAVLMRWRCSLITARTAALVSGHPHGTSTPYLRLVSKNEVRNEENKLHVIPKSAIILDTMVNGGRRASFLDPFGVTTTLQNRARGLRRETDSHDQRDRQRGARLV
jgi:hypothetical protein